MRELKFRVWDGKAMTYPKTIEIGVNHWNNLPSASYQLDYGGYCTSSYVMQYTGVVDKDGKEIYEGDILSIETDDGIVNGEVTFNCGSFIWHGMALLNDVNITKFEFHKVIGNIYENPNLLKENK